MNNHSFIFSKCIVLVRVAVEPGAQGHENNTSLKINQQNHSHQKSFTSAKWLSWNWTKSVRSYSEHASAGITAALWHAGWEKGVRGGKTTRAQTFKTLWLRNGLISPLKDKDGWRLKWNGHRGREAKRWILLMVSLPNSETYSDCLTALLQ